MAERASGERCPGCGTQYKWHRGITERLREREEQIAKAVDAFTRLVGICKHIDTSDLNVTPTQFKSRLAMANGALAALRKE